MSQEFTLSATMRQDVGKGASRRLRRLQDLVPGVVYGGDKEPASISLEHRKIVKALENEAFYSHILTLTVDGNDEKVLLKDLQRHPFKPKIMHIDFQRITGQEKIQRYVPLHFLNEENCPAKRQGAVVSHHLKELEISCKVSNLPEFIAVDLNNLDLEKVIHISDLTLPAGIQAIALMHEHDQAVASANMPRAAIEEETGAEEDGESKAN